MEFFSCAGGMSEGFRRAGVLFDIVVDRSAVACDSYEINFGYRPLQMDVHDFLRIVESGFRPGRPLDLLVADPPCQPWSRAGHRKGISDTRDCLQPTIDLIRILRPKTYLIANVPGLDDEKGWATLQTLLEPLAEVGYCTRDYAKLNAASYGVPQHRVRPFWFGHLAGPCIRWPEPTHQDPKLPNLPGFDLKPWVTCREALAHLTPAELGKPVRIRLTERNHKGSRADKPARTVTGNTHSDGVIVVTDRHTPSMMPHEIARPADSFPPSRPDAPSKTTRDCHGAGTLMWPWERPATTVTGNPRIPAPGHHGKSYLSTANAVHLSERAAATLQGFPEGWVFLGKTKTDRWLMIGQALPPPLAEAVARSIRAQWAETQMPKPKRRPARGGASAARPEEG
jgi:DNA (cytosine-5)-methyltransferase 1